MIMAFPAALALVQQCAPGIAPEALLSIVSVESGFDPLSINVNHVGRLHAKDPQDAATLAGKWIAAGYSVDLGLAQINSRNLGWTGLSIAAAFEPCANLSAAEKVLQASYARASRDATGLDAISRTFSFYNSGSPTTGFRNLYVSRVWRAALQVLPQLPGATMLPSAVATVARDPRAIVAPLVNLSFVIGPGAGSVLTFK